MNTLKTKATIVCIECGIQRAVNPTAKGNPRPPKGWKPGPTCAECWAKRYVMRVIALPVNTVDNGEWKDFCRDLYSGWNAVTQCANWMMTELYRRDPQRLPSDEKLRPMERVYLYPEAMRVFKDHLPASVVANLEQQMQALYRSDRFELIWLRKRSLRTLRDLPYPVPKQAFRIGYSTDNQGKPMVTATLQSGGTRWQIRLANGDNFRRQLRTFAEIAANDDLRAELSFYRQRQEGNTGRRTTTERTNGGGQREHYRIMAKICAWIPRGEAPPDGRTMTLRTDATRFLVAEIDGREFVLNMDHIARLRQWMAKHDDYLERMALDTKYEKRWPKKNQLHMNEAREVRCEKNWNRIKTALQQSVAAVAGWAQRNRVSSVSYNDDCRSYLPHAPWALLATFLHQKFESLGIASAGMVKPKPARKAKATAEDETISGEPNT